ncbi:nuclear factor NF-kappa-B p110 subunit-like isoform X2 [Contarinia nasturtii]|nr:nuclear factor NF-kappa-B p110 subunit-like isoform X2 [Contarinia nasturtii]
MNTDGNIHLYGSTMSSPMSGNMSPISNSMSPVSSSDSSSAYHFQQLQISSNANEYFVNTMNTKMDEPFLEIMEQPIDKFRFRYKSEMHGTHGMLTGQHSKKTFPAVRLRNFTGEALIRCSLYQIWKPGHELPFPHSHSLVVRCGNDDKKDPHEAMVSQLHGYKATFQGMGIIHTARKHIEDELYDKLVGRAEFEKGCDLTKPEKDLLRSKAKKHSNDMNLNQVSLCFEAYERVNGKWMRLCEPIFSTPINNLKSALTGELKISRMSSVIGSAAGNDDLFIFVEKVGKKNIKVRFFEQDDDQIIWEDWGKFTEADVHHQYAIALKTPPYREVSIDESVKVYIQLYRPGDEAISEPVEFRYKPCVNFNLNMNRKRPRVASFYDSDIPVVVAENAFVRNPSDSYVPQMDNTSNDTDIDQIISDLFSNSPNELLDPEEFTSLLQQLNENPNCASSEENSEFDKLAKDSVSIDDDHSNASLSKEEKWIAQFLNKINPLIKGHNVTNSRVCRKFFEFIFQRVLFNGNNIMHICAKSDDLKQMNCIWEIIHKFQLYDLLDIRNYNKETCAHFASAMNKTSVLEELIKYGIDLNAVDADGNTALHIAIREKNDDCVAVIMNSSSNKWGKEVEINLSILNDSGFTPLHMASMTNNVNIVKMLDVKSAQMKKPIFDDVEGKHGNNALHIAIESDAHNVAEYLIQNKCINPSKVNKSNHTALYLARVANSMDLVNLMQRYISVDNEQSMDDDDDASSKDSFESQEINKTTTEAKQTSVIVKTESCKLQERQDAKKFDKQCLDELCVIFNKNDKWKSIAMILGYQDCVESWQKSRNPTRILLTYAESLKVSKETIVDICVQLGEKNAVNCIDEWKKGV